MSHANPFNGHKPRNTPNTQNEVENGFRVVRVFSGLRIQEAKIISIEFESQLN